MRLLNTTTLKIHEFTGKEIPKYAILSHRWEAQESTFQDARDRRNLDLHGWKKIERFCAVARKWDWEYAWADTCCIDKTSSSELSEAINSMYSWYRNAEECYAYLSDVPSNLDQDAQIAALRQSKWFTRGWTLQELLAPTELYFLDSNWKIFGSKKTLDGVLSEITGIENVSNIHSSTVSVATRMSWASQRECSREEDKAYCLMGIFGINMPLLYGEGENAFRRLQLEILATSDDESLFAWWSPKDDFKLQTGLLATSPQDFRDSADISQHPFYPDRAPYNMTNKGLQIEACLIPCKWLLENEEGQTNSRDDSPFTSHVESNDGGGEDRLMDRRYLFSDSGRRFRGDNYWPLPPSSSELPTEHRIWIFPLNCRVRSNPYPVVLILANWGSKSGQCCRLFSEKSTDQSFGSSWGTTWREYVGRTTLIYIREADAEARQLLGKKYIIIPPMTVQSNLYRDGIDEDALSLVDFDFNDSLNGGQSPRSASPIYSM